MTELDELVWRADDPEAWPRLRKALHAFESASMIAGVRRDLSNWYVTTRVALYRQSRRNYDRHGGPDEGGGWLERHHLQGLNEAAEMIYQLCGTLSAPGGSERGDLRQPRNGRARL